MTDELIKRAEGWRCGVNSPVTKAEAEAFRIIQDLLTALKGRDLDNAAAQMLQAIEEAHPEGGMPNWMIKPYWDLREAWRVK